MIQLSCIFEKIANKIVNVIGLDLFTEFDAPDRHWCDFERWPHGRQGSEYFGFGLHLVVSPLQMSPH